MNTQEKNRQPRLWVLIVVILVLLGICLLALALAGVLFIKSRGATLSDFVSNPFQKEPQIKVTEIVPQIVEQETIPQEPPLQDETIPQIQPTQEEASPHMQAEDFLLAITSTGIWKINENTQEVTQISPETVDAPSPYRKGLSPDKKYFAYITGDINPTLVILDLQNQTRFFETPLSSPTSQITSNMTAADPGLSVLLAMQMPGSLSWSPDSTELAFVAAMDQAHTDLYLFNTTDRAINRLSNEVSNAAYLNWSPDGRFIEYLTVNNFGTGAGMDMDAIWVYDRSMGSSKLLEQSNSGGEVFLSWIDNETFYIYSWSAMCENFNLRTIDAVTGSQESIRESCFSGAAFDQVNQFGIVSVSDILVGACQCGEVEEYGTYSFGESLGLSDVGIMIKKFEPINAYNVELLDPGNLFAVYTDQGLAHLFDNTGFAISIPSAVSGLKPLPSPGGDYWAWFPYFGEKSGLWVTVNEGNPIELSTTSSGNVLWNENGSGLYFYEQNKIYYADAPSFTPALFAEIIGSEIYAIGN